MSLIEDEPGRGNTPEFTVSELSRGVKRTLEDAYGAVRVRGELGRVTFHRNGHVYLDLKDENAVLAGVVWKSSVRGLEIRPQEGDEVIASGRITTFAGQSKYQLVIDQLSYAGEGALLAKLERLRKALAAEGLFDVAHKRPLPYLPRVIGVVTSPTGAVIRDILHRLADRFPVHVLVWPVAVQGPGSATSVAEAIRGFNAMGADGPIPRPDLLIVARGGGSIEDLWGFNEEVVVRAAAGSTIPLISAVGHETDTTLIDHAADRRAPTPTAAAEMAVPVRADLVATLADLEARRRRALRRALDNRRERLVAIARALPKGAEIIETRRQRLAALRLPDPRRLVADARARLSLPSQRLAPGLTARLARARLALERPIARLTDRSLRERTRLGREQSRSLARRLAPGIARRLTTSREALQARARLLESLSHRRTLARGFVLVADENGALVTRAADTRAAHRLTLTFSDGQVAVRPDPTDTGEATPPLPAPSPAPARKAAKAKPATARRSATAGTPAAQGSLFDD
ncbi:MAG: exodeoxyribonuclease VII large subunit [Pseudomonadota bacterium]